jgi:hypothetical protein
VGFLSTPRYMLYRDFYAGLLVLPTVLMVCIFVGSFKQSRPKIQTISNLNDMNDQTMRPIGLMRVVRASWRVASVISRLC